MSPTTAAHGEDIVVPERVIVAPAVGVFEPATPAGNGNGNGAGAGVPNGSVDGNASAAAGGAGEGSEAPVVREGEVVGVIVTSGRELPVRSAFTGRLMGLLAHSGERVREGQPVAWLRVH